MEMNRLQLVSQVLKYCLITMLALACVCVKNFLKDIRTKNNRDHFL